MLDDQRLMDSKDRMEKTSNQGISLFCLAQVDRLGVR
jgi:hypothetical protein